MFHSYPKNDLNSAQENLGLMFDCLVNKYGLDHNMAAQYFCASGFDKKFENGEISVISGMSGSEIAGEVYDACNSSFVLRDDDLSRLYFARSKEYWAGSYLAAYQWETGHLFEEIFSRIPFEEIVLMYQPYHEMDAARFIEEMEKRYISRVTETNLKKIREAVGLSQAELAEKAEVNIRSIQMFEQRVNDINKAQVGTLYRLAKVLFCNVEDLMEM